MNEWLGHLDWRALMEWAPWGIGALAGVVVLACGVRLAGRGSAGPRPRSGGPDPADSKRSLSVPKSLLARPPAERRRAPRRRGGSVTLEVADGDGTVLPFRAWIVDRSVGGLCLAVEEPFEVDTVFLIRPTPNGAPLAWTQMQTRHCHKRGNLWEVGCRFVQAPDAAVMVLFG